MTTSIKKEFWEYNKILTWVPAIIALLVIVMPTLVLIVNEVPFSSIFEELKEMPKQFLSPEHEAMLPKLFFIMLLSLFSPFIAVAVIVQLYYFTTCLFDERRDLSVLFWRSLPVSDSVTLAAKLFTGTILIPAMFLLAATITAVFIALLFFIVCIILSVGFDINLWGIWLSAGVVSSISIIWLTLLPYAVWMLPLFSWLMLASMFANKAPVLWAILPLAVILLIEAFIVHYFHLSQPLLANLIFDYFSITPEMVNSVQAENEIVRTAPIQVLMSKLNVGSLMIPAMLLYLTYWLRVNRTEV
jgi:ABC-2 type transport system permease protein